MRPNYRFRNASPIRPQHNKNIFPQENDDIYNWTLQYPQFYDLAQDPVFWERKTKMAKNFDLPLKTYLDYYMEDLKQKYPEDSYKQLA